MPFAASGSSPLMPRTSSEPRSPLSRAKRRSEDISLGALVSDAADQVRSEADNKGVSMRLRNGGETRVTADQDLLLQLILNLLDNAVKHTPSGGSIDVSWSKADGQAKVVVSDEGPGIPTEHLPRIFDRFYRVDKARSREGGGVGLGLSICRWIAQAHGGTIQADNAPGQGATFTVHLPIN